MAKNYKTVNIDDPLYESLSDLAVRVARKEGLIKISIKQLIERMKKVYEDTVEL